MLMKSKILILCTLVLTIFLTGCTTNKINSISYEKFKEKIDDKESLILFFGESKSMESTLNSVLNDNNLEAYKIKVEKLSDDELNELKNIIYYQDPSICFIVNGENPTILTNIEDEYVTKTKLENVLKDLNFIKE